MPNYGYNFTCFDTEFWYFCERFRYNKQKHGIVSTSLTNFHLASTNTEFLGTVLVIFFFFALLFYRILSVAFQIFHTESVLFKETITDSRIYFMTITK